MKNGRSGWLLGPLGFLALVIGGFGCGEEVATPGASIQPPEDITITYQPTAGGLDIFDSPLEFQVFVDENAIDEPTDEPRPMPGATMRFYGGLQVTALTDKDRNPLNPDDPLFFETQTDDRGLSPTDVYAVFFVPQCKADPDPTKNGPDISVTGTVTASVGVDSATWKVNIIVTGGKQPPCAL